RGGRGCGTRRTARGRAPRTRRGARPARARAGRSTPTCRGGYRRRPWLHALRAHGEREDLLAVLAAPEGAAHDLLLDAGDALQRGLELIDLLGRLGRALEVDLVVLDVDQRHVERELVARGQLAVDLHEQVVGRHLGQRRLAAGDRARRLVIDLLH